MSVTRIALIIASLLTAFYVGTAVRRHRIAIGHSMFWLLLAFFLLLTSIFPQYLYFISNVLGIQSPSNAAFLIMIFILILKVFLNSVTISQLEARLNHYIEEDALSKVENEPPHDKK